MKFILLALFSSLALADTVTIPISVTVTPTTVTVTVPGQTTTIPVPTAPVTPPVVTPPANGAFWVYQNGVFNWGGDYSFVLTPNYKDTTGFPGGYDLKATLTGAWGGWLPFAGKTVPQWNMDVSGYTKLTFDAKGPAGQKWSVYFVKVGDVALPSSCTVPVSASGTGWETHVLTLSALCVGPGLAGGTQIYKFAIQDQTGKSANSWYLNNVGFVP